MSLKQQLRNDVRGKKGKKGQQQDRSLTEPILTEREGKQQAWAETRPEYRPVIQQMQREKRGSVQRQKNIGQMFQGLQNTIQQSAAATDASYAQANNALTAHMQAAQAAGLKAQDSIAKNNVDLTALTGADPRLTVPALAEGAAAAQQRDIARAALAAPIAQAGASQAAYLRSTGINAQREGIDQKLKEASRRDTIKEDIRDATKERAEKAQQRFGEIRKGERDYKIQRSAFNLDKKEGELDNALRERELAQEDRRLNQGGGDSEGPTAAEQRDQKRAWNNAWSAAQAQFKSEPPPSNAKEWAIFQTYLQEQSEVSPAMAAKAVRILKRRLKKQSKGSGIAGVNVPW